MPVHQIDAQPASINPDPAVHHLTVAGRELLAGDVLHEHDWNLHVRRVDVETGGGVAYVTAEFPDFLQHLGADQLVEVDR